MRHINRKGHLIHINKLAACFKDMNSVEFMRLPGSNDCIAVKMILDYETYENTINTTGLSQLEEIIMVEAIRQALEWFFMYKVRNFWGRQIFYTFDFNDFLGEFHQMREEFEGNKDKLMEYYDLDELAHDIKECIIDRPTPCRERVTIH